MSWPGPPHQTPPGGWAIRALAQALRETLTDPQGLTDTGVGQTLVGALSDLARAIDRVAFEMRRYNDRRDETKRPFWLRRPFRPRRPF